MRDHPRQEPGAVTPPAGIRAGGGGTKTAVPTATPTRQSAPNHANAPHSAPSQHAPQIKPKPLSPPPSSILHPPSSLPRPLTPNQLRAARLLVAGHSTTAIAATLQIDRHSLARRKRLPLFQLELRHLIDQTS